MNKFSDFPIPWVSEWVCEWVSEWVSEWMCLVKVCSVLSFFGVSKWGMELIYIYIYIIYYFRNSSFVKYSYTAIWFGKFD